MKRMSTFCLMAATLMLCASLAQAQQATGAATGEKPAKKAHATTASAKPAGSATAKATTAHAKGATAKSAKSKTAAMPATAAATPAKGTMAASAPAKGTVAATAASAPAKGTVAVTPAAATPAMATPAKTAPAKAAMASGKGVPAGTIDLNSASKAELMKLPGVGEAISDKIIKGRPYANKAQLVSRGIVNKATYDKLSGMVIAKQSK